MRRRDVIAGAAATLVAPPFVRAQQPRLPVVAYLGSTTRESSTFDDFVQDLGSLGYVNGRTVRIVPRWSDGNNERLASLARELVALEPDVLCVTTGTGVLATRELTTTIPIIMESGVAADVAVRVAGPNFARPIANVTGMVTVLPALVGKQLELAAELVPGAARIGLLDFTRFAARPETTREADAAASALGINLVRVEINVAADLDQAFRALAAQRTAAVVAPPASLFVSERARMVALAAETRLPTVHSGLAFVMSGGLLSYAIDTRAASYRAATFVDRVLRGARPGDLPVEIGHPLLAVNLKTARDLGIALPLAILARADVVIE